MRYILSAWLLLTSLLSPVHAERKTDVAFKGTWGSSTGVISVSSGRVWADGSVKDEYAILTPYDLDGKTHPEFGQNGHAILYLPGFQTTLVDDIVSDGETLAILGRALAYDARFVNEIKWMRGEYELETQSSLYLDLANEFKISLDDAVRLNRAKTENHYFIKILDAKTGKEKSHIKIKDLDVPGSSNPMTASWLKHVSVRRFMRSGPTNFLIVVDHERDLTGTKDYLNEPTRIYQVLPDGQLDLNFGREGAIFLSKRIHTSEMVRHPDTQELFVAGTMDHDHSLMVVFQVDEKKGRATEMFRYKHQYNQASIRFLPRERKAVSFDNGVGHIVPQYTGRVLHWQLDKLLDGSRNEAGVLRIGHDLYFYGSDPQGGVNLNLVAFDAKPSSEYAQEKPTHSFAIDRDKQWPQFCDQLGTLFAKFAERVIFLD